MLKLAILIASATACLAIRSELDVEWELYKKTYKKEYYSEETYRRQVWENNTAFIQLHNLEADRGVHSYWVGMNEYGDMTSEEFVATMNGYRTQNDSVLRWSTVTAPDLGGTENLPSDVDWRKEGYVTPIKNQGQCGSCWAFSSTGSLEGQHFKKSGKLVSLSEQNLVDCSDGNMGCKGGWMNNAFLYVRDNDGIDTEASYPYTAQQGSCKFNRKNVGATCSGFVNIKAESEADLQAAVANIGPISVAMDASHSSFRFYKGGIYSDPACNSAILDHAVLVIGYGVEGGKDFWLVKNSWGTSWGMQGYFQLARNFRNMCGVASKASYPLV